MYNKKELELINISVPNRSWSYTPISHQTLIDLSKQELQNANLTIVDTKYQHTKNKKVVTGTFTVEGFDKDFGMSLSFINSYDKTRAVGIVAGVKTFVCLNGCISGDVSFQRKHQGNVDQQIHSKIREQIARMKKRYSDTLDDFTRWKKLPFSRNNMAKAAGLMFYNDMFNASQLSIIKQEIKNPSFDYGTKDTLYDFFQHTTHALKKSHASTVLKDHINVYKRFAKIEKYL